MGLLAHVLTLDQNSKQHNLVVVSTYALYFGLYEAGGGLSLCRQGKARPLRGDQKG